MTNKVEKISSVWKDQFDDLFEIDYQFYHESKPVIPILVLRFIFRIQSVISTLIANNHFTPNFGSLCTLSLDLKCFEFNIQPDLKKVEKNEQ